MIKIYISILFMTCSMVLSGQDKTQGSCSSSGTMMPQRTTVNTTQNRHILPNKQKRNTDRYVSSENYFEARQQYTEIKGSPFWHQQGVQGQVIDNSGNETEVYTIYYDGYANTIVVEDSRGKEQILPYQDYQELILQEEGKFVSYKKIHPDQPSKFFKILFESEDIVFFKDKAVKLSENKMGSELVKRFHAFENYYICMDGKVSKVKLKKKDIYKLIPQVQTIALEEYTKHKKIKLRTESDFVTALANVYQ